MIGGQAQTGIPYAKISDDDWPKWKAFLPVKSEVICKKELFGRPKAFLCLPRDDARSQTF
jgi:hypothetical protein